MSVNLAQTDGTEGIDGEVMGPLPQPAKPKDDNCATAVAAPSFSSSRRVKFPIACVLDALSEAKVGPHGNSVSIESLPFLVPRRLFSGNGWMSLGYARSAQLRGHRSRQIIIVAVAVLVAAVFLPSYRPIVAGLAAIAMGCASCGWLPLVPAVVNVLNSPFPIATTAVPVLHCRMHCRAQIKQSSQWQGQCP